MATDGEIRIMGGQWRGRKLPVPRASGLRPTGARMRETLFNWLQPQLPGARVLDLCAGTGILGLEALSRGAAHCVWLERQRPLADQLRRNAAQLQAEGRIICCNMLDWLARPGGQAYDIVFLDPPFSDNLWNAALQALRHDWLHPAARVYCERPRHQPIASDHYEIIREKRMGANIASLLQPTDDCGPKDAS